MSDETSRGAWGKVLLLALFVCLILGGMAGFAWWRHWKWRWEKIAMPERVAQVPREWAVEELAKRLQQRGKVRDASAFLEAAGDFKLQRIAPGGYMLPKEAGPRELAEIFSRPPELWKVTFPEGWTAGEMAKRLAGNKFADAGTFNRLAYPANATVSPWEGKLFPDTYYLSPKAPAKKIMLRLHDRFQQVAKDLPAPFPTGPGGKALTLDEVVILASLVEREAATSEERPLIAGVLLNRLKKGMRLQCDATVQYARQRAVASGLLAEGEGHKARLLYEDLVIESPYNTYRNGGLPPGPICNPGEDSLKAAAQPEDSHYLFYVMSPRLGRHRFAKTFEEHKHNIALANQEE